MEQADFADLARAAARLLELRIDPEGEPELIRNLALLQRHATRVLEFPLDETQEMAPVFQPSPAARS